MPDKIIYDFVKAEAYKLGMCVEEWLAVDAEIDALLELSFFANEYYLNALKSFKLNPTVPNKSQLNPAAEIQHKIKIELAHYLEIAKNKH